MANLTKSEHSIATIMMFVGTFLVMMFPGRNTVLCFSASQEMRAYWA